MFGGKRRDRSAIKAAEAQREAEQQLLLAALADRPDTVCPFLGTDAYRADFHPEPTEDHRCYSFGEAAPLSHEQQGRVCLQRGYGNCPRYLRGLLVIPTDEMEAIRRRKAEAAMKRLAPPPPPVVPDPPVVAPAAPTHQIPPTPAAPPPRPVAYEETLLTLPAPAQPEVPAEPPTAAFAPGGVDTLEELAKRQEHEAAENARLSAAAAEAAAKAEEAAERARLAAGAEAAMKAERAAENARLAAAAEAAAKAQEAARVAEAATAAKAAEAAEGAKAAKAAEAGEAAEAAKAAKVAKAAAMAEAKAARAAKPAKPPKAPKTGRPPRARRQPRPVVSGPRRMRMLVEPRQAPQRMLVALDPDGPIVNRPGRLAAMAAAAVVLALALVVGGGIVAYGELRSDALAAGAVATESPAPSATPTPTPEPTPQPTPRPTRSPRPTASPSPEATSSPSPRATVTPDPTSRTWTYVIRDYDSISLIAQRYGTTTETLMDLNPSYRDDPNHVQEGDPLIVPCTRIAIDEGRCP